MTKNRLLVTKQFIIYCMIGAFTSLTDTLVFYILRKLNVNLFIANSIGINVGITLSFLLNTFINFKMTDKLKQRAIKFFMVGYIGLCISFVIMYIGVKILNQKEMLVKLVSIVLVAIIQFCLNKLFTYRNSNKEKNI